MNIVFFGTDEFAAIALEYLMKKEVGICAVVTTPDEPAGRKKNLQTSPVAVLAKKYNLPVLQPQKFDTETCTTIRGYHADVGLLTVYGKILPSTVLTLFPKGIVNIHPSLLPAYRGASPIKTALLNGCHETGITIITLDDKMDHGPILAQSKTEILPDETLPELRNRLALIGAHMAYDVLPQYMAGTIVPTAQDHSHSTYTKLLTKENGRVDWTQSPQEIYNQFRALVGWPGTWTEWRGKRIKIIRMHIPTTNDAFKKVDDLFSVNEERTILAIPCAHGVLVIDELQVEGKNPLSGRDFINGSLAGRVQT